MRGTITYYQPGVALVLQDGSKSIWVDTASWNPLRVGTVAEATGFPEVENGFFDSREPRYGRRCRRRL